MKALISLAIAASIAWHTGQASTIRAGFERALTLSSVLAQAEAIARR